MPGRPGIWPFTDHEPNGYLADEARERLERSNHLLSDLPSLIEGTLAEFEFQNLTLAQFSKLRPEWQFVCAKKRPRRVFFCEAVVPLKNIISWQPALPLSLALLLSVQPLPLALPPLGSLEPLSTQHVDHADL
jgi:hypothetical protein